MRWAAVAAAALGLTGLLLAGAACAQAPAPPPVTLLKCCPEGQELGGDRTVCGPPQAGADPDDEPDDPNQPHLTVYWPERRSTIEGVPRTWTVTVAKPVCRNSVGVTVVPVDRSTYPAFVVFSNGSVFVVEHTVFVDAGSFCVDNRAALVCIQDGPAAPAHVGARVTVKKCCGQGAAFNEAAGACVLQSGPAGASLASVLPPELAAAEGVALTAGFPACPEGDLAIAGVVGARDVRLRTDGSLSLRPGSAAGATLPPGEFCLERVLGAAGSSAGVSVLACHARFAPPRDSAAPGGGRVEVEDDLRFALYPIGLMLSVFFLAVTLATGFLLPGSHHMLHWRCQTAHVACLLVGDLLLAITQMAGASLPPAACTAIAVFMHFFFLAAFFWLNTMCFNIWWTFRDLRPNSLDKSQEVCRLRMYQLYAWGAPLVIAGIAAIVDNLPEESYTSVLRPRFGHQRCWFYGDAEIFSYFYGPVGLLLALNLILFAATARELTCGLWKREVVKSSTERATLGRVCLKLVVVMGLTWVADVISWAVGGPHVIWYVTDLFNALQGVFIFAVVGCQPQVWAAVNRLWCWQIPRAGATNIGQQVSTYSQGLPSLGDSVTHSHTHKSPPLETMC